MQHPLKLSVLSVVVAAAAGFGSVVVAGQDAPPKKMGFFVTSVGSGKGGDLGGLAGADKHCQALAQAVGAGGRTWRAYLSTSASGATSAINARDRIGAGPWYNAKGVLVARNVDELHLDNNLNKQTALTEKGDVVNGRGDTPNTHDMLTGSDSHGHAFPGELDTTCGNWTKSGDGSAQVGHHDRTGLDGKPPAKSWNHSHPSRGCSVDALKSSGGGGLFYCFAAK
ncbi:hypothetical protein [Propionivibrio sp.]|uniref:hypothetical protein n=1 Tax=Propionivibrio sp. TaxID=2212460 RepID=UPI00260A1234|nr:hypothetical protein [Propionivibrio sp.]